MSIPSILNVVPTQQNWVCISFLVDKDVSSTTAIRIGGVFKDYNEACEHAKQIREVDIYNNVFVGELGEWLPFDPKPTDKTKVEQTDYLNKDLDNLMKSRVKEQNKANIVHELRKSEEQHKNDQKNLDLKNKNREELVEKLKNIKNDNEKNSVENILSTLDEKINETKERLKAHSQTIEKLNGQLKE
uniref:Uncharacterized protein n=1 Tax=Megaviridae environmental sample TaxID=1737588 RepID=A0A5J6VKY1_9VIRU|nr:MAG: hypothetical protein [Megaviridae environmental sample]